MERDWEILLEAAHRQTRAQELGNPPVRKERDLKDSIGDAELIRLRTKSVFEGRPAVRHGDQPDVDSHLLELFHCGKQRKGSLDLAELSIDPEIRTVCCEFAPKRLMEFRIVQLDLLPKR